jgi:hypothetical protein
MNIGFSRVSAVRRWLVAVPLHQNPVADARDRLSTTLVGIVLLVACAGLFLTAPVHGDFWWSDAPRHALNGAFLKDFVAAFPWRDPRGWAVDYYLQYPALSILFYPPLFYIFEAVAYSILGVTHPAAQATVILFVFLLGVASYRIARFTFPRWSALGLSLLVIGAPETAFWARQVMLDVPAYAAVVVAAFFFIRYLETDRQRDIYLAVFAELAAVYIKLNAVFIAPVFLMVFILAAGPRALRRREAIGAALLGAVGLVPAVLLTLRFGGVNVQSVAGRQTDLPRTSIEAWLFYAKRLPHDLGYLTAILAAIGFILLVLSRSELRQRWIGWLMIGWFGFGYFFFSAIGVREPRHGLMLEFPLAICAVLALHRFLPTRAAEAATAGLGFATFVYSLLFMPPPAIGGYREVADYVAAHAPRNAVVVFSGYRDGNFVFDMRTHEERRDIATLRADKLLLDVAVERLRGVGEKGYDEAAIAKMLRELGVSLVVFQPGFWQDLREMARFAAVLNTRDFQRVASFDITGTVAHTDRFIEIYKPTYPVEQTEKRLRLDMPIIGDEFKGDVGTK